MVAHSDVYRVLKMGSARKSLPSKKNGFFSPDRKTTSLRQQPKMVSSIIPVREKAVTATLQLLLAVAAERERVCVCVCGYVEGERELSTWRER